MSIDTVLTAARQAAEALMVDACTITRRTADRGPFDEATGRYAPAPTATVYAGRCQVQAPDVAVREVESGERTASLLERIVKLPVLTSVGVQIDDLVTVTACQWDPDLIGRSFPVVGLHSKSYASARRLRCTEEADQ